MAAERKDYRPRKLLSQCAALGLAAAIAGLSAAAQTRPRDIDGWNEVKWGMTVDQVRELHPGAIQSDTAAWTHLQLPAIHAGDIPLEVDAGARKPSGRVTLITLWCAYGLPDGVRGAAPQLGPRDFDTLKDALLRKYGSPRDELSSVDAGDSLHSYYWVFPSGSITLQLRQNRRTNTLGSFRVEYRAAEKVPL